MVETNRTRIGKANNKSWDLGRYWAPENRRARELGLC
jgi:hypothetical protein